MHTKTPISSIENPIFMLLILINVTYGSDTNCWIVFNNFTVGFLSMLVFQTIWRNKNEHKTEIKMKKEEKSVFKVFREITDERLWSTPPVPILTVFTVWPKTEPCSEFQMRNLVFLTMQPSSVRVVRVSVLERSVVEPRYTTGFLTV